MSEETKVETPVVETKKEEAVVEVQQSPEEERASTRGWMPKEQWVEAGHNEEDWKPAKVFIEHGDMIGKIRSLEKRTAEADRALQFLHQKNQQIYQTGYDAALKQLRSEKRQALAEGDLVKADEIDERIDLTKQELHKAVNTPPPIPKQQQVDPEHVEWLQRNSWYNDGVMQKFADALAIEYINVNKGQVSANDVRDFVEKEVKKEFSHKFKKTTTAAPSPDGDGRSGSGQTKGTALDSRLAKAKAEMSEEERSIMKTMIRSTGLTEKKYLELYLN